LTALQFEDRETDYLQWLDEHPNGYVLTTQKVFHPEIRLHSSKCFYIGKYMRHMRPDAFTGGLWKKVCSSDVDELYQWAADQGYIEVSTCKVCLRSFQPPG
jgi:hypothetical protein